MLIFDALLIDMDGTLVDSTAAVEGVWRAFCGAYGIDPNDLLPRTRGTQTLDVVAHYLGNTGEAGSISKMLERSAADITDGIQARQGAVDLLAALPKGSWALVTSAGRALAESRMTAAGLEMPAVVVSAEDISPGKPHPGCYRLAAQLLGVNIAECAVLEDAPAGIEAGTAAGALVINVGAPLREAPHQIIQVNGLECLRIESHSGKIGITIFDTI